MIFYQEDDLKIKRKCYLISEYRFNHNNYVIYTDFVSGSSGEDFRLLAGKIINNNVIRLDKESENVVLTDFRKQQDNVINQLMEVFK